MALVLKDRVKETTTTTGTGTYTLAGAVAGFEAFSEIGNSNTTYYCCTDGTDFEVGIGTYTLSGTTLARTTILQSSNSDNAVNWSSGSRTIFCTQPAEKAVFLDADGKLGPITIDGDADGVTPLTLENNDTGAPFLTATYTGASAGNRSYILKTPTSDSTTEPFVWETGNKHQFNTDSSRRLVIQDSGIDVTGDITVSGTVDGRDVAADGATADAALPKAGGTMTGNLELNNANIVFEGSTADANETTLTAIDPTADRTISLPNQSGTAMVTIGDSFRTGISQTYSGTGSPAYLVDGEYQEIATVTPSGNSHNYFFTGRIVAQSGQNVHTLNITAALRSNTLPDLSFTANYDEDVVGTASQYITPVLFTKETSPASFILAVEVHNTIFGTLTADLDFFARTQEDLADISVNTTDGSEITSTPSGYTLNQFTKTTALDNGNQFVFNQDVQFTGSNYNAVWDKSQNRLEFADNAAITFGTGNDISLDWDGTDGHLTVAGTLNIEGSGETLAKFIDDGAVELYHNNVKTFETTSAGVTVTGDATVSGDLFVNGGTIRSEDGTLDFGDNSGDNWGQISFQSTDTNGFDSQFDNSVRFSNEQGSTNQHMLLMDTAANNSADLWGVSVNNTPIVSITGQSKIVLHEADGGSNTTTISPTSPTANRTLTLPDATGTVLLTDGDGSSLTALNATQLTSGTVPNARLDAQLQDVAGLAVTNGNFIVGDGSNFVAESGATARASLGLGTAATSATGDFATAAQGTTADAAMPKAGGTFTGDVTFTGDNYNIVFDKSDDALEFADNAKATFGDSADATIRHTGSNLQIFETTGGIQITNYANDLDVDIRTDDGSGGTALYFKADGSTGAAELYHYGTKRLQTTSTGVTIPGDLFITDNAAGFGQLELAGASGAYIDLKSPSSDDFDLRFITDGTVSNIRADDLHLQSASAENYIDATANGAVNLYYDNVKKLETTADGVDIISTDDGNTIGPKLHLYRDSASPADFDDIGSLYFSGNDSGGNKQEYAYIRGDMFDVTNGTEDGATRFYTTVNGTAVEHMQHSFGTTTVYGRLYLTGGGIHSNPHLRFEGSTNNDFETDVYAANPTADRTITLPDATGTVLTTGNSDTPTTTTSSSDADFVLVDDGGTMKKITPANLGITAGAASTDDATALAIALG